MKQENIYVTIDSGAGFLKYTNKIKLTPIQIESGTSYLDAIELSGIPKEDVGFISVNGIKKEKDGIASDQDTIRPLPYIISG